MSNFSHTVVRLPLSSQNIGPVFCHVDATFHIQWPPSVLSRQSVQWATSRLSHTVALPTTVLSKQWFYHVDAFSIHGFFAYLSSQNSRSSALPRRPNSSHT